MLGKSGPVEIQASVLLKAMEYALGGLPSLGNYQTRLIVWCDLVGWLTLSAYAQTRGGEDRCNMSNSACRPSTLKHARNLTDRVSLRVVFDNVQVPGRLKTCCDSDAKTPRQMS